MAWEAASLVKKEMPKLLLLFPAIDFKGYRSRLSNADLIGQEF